MYHASFHEIMLAKLPPTFHIHIKKFHVACNGKANLKKNVSLSPNSAINEDRPS